MEEEHEVCSPAPARNPSLLPLLASPHRVTAGLQLQRCPPLPSPPRANSSGAGGGAAGSRPDLGRCAPRLCWKVMTLQLPPSPRSQFRGVSRSVSVSPSHLPATRSGRLGRSQGCPRAAWSGAARPPPRASQPAPPPTQGLSGPAPPRWWETRPRRRARVPRPASSLLQGAMRRGVWGSGGDRCGA